ncbi:unnamed protein product [Enterobius vermicularis]|uniref:Nas2_N domain-containing protein n=1 Tax=Enterobius vermicularis TaxID=51028 RepID=A0A0N4USK7_ENTVE|nr:unnamed protein product [Enterobius vermicularis]
MSLLSEAKKLMEKRDELDSFIEEQQAILKTSGVDMNSPLVDKDDYPLADIDIYAVRNARNALICAQNDRRNLTEQIESLIHRIHEEARTDKQVKLEGSASKTEEVHRTSNRAFAKIDRVAPDSPARASGLMAGDPVLQFASLHAGNFKGIEQLIPLVKNSEGVPIKITVLREGKALRLELTPKKWSGPGLLGCSFLPLTSSKMI